MIPHRPAPGGAGPPAGGAGPPERLRVDGAELHRIGAHLCTEGQRHRERLRGVLDDELTESFAADLPGLAAVPRARELVARWGDTGIRLDAAVEAIGRLVAQAADEHDAQEHDLARAFQRLGEAT